MKTSQWRKYFTSDILTRPTTTELCNHEFCYSVHLALHTVIQFIKKRMPVIITLRTVFEGLGIPEPAARQSECGSFSNS